MEVRRLQAAEDLMAGVSQSHVARKFGVSRTTASRWQRALRGSGKESLRKRRATGRPSRLSVEQLEQVKEMFAQGPAAFGYPRWTTARLAKAIEARFGVRYDPDHVGRLMHRLGLREQRGRVPAPTHPAASYVFSRYSPNTDLSRPEISPTVA
jgi:transposase